MLSNDDGATAGAGRGGTSSSSLDSPELARQIVSILRANNIHPVLVFGTQASGKTMMLRSLFGYVKSSDDSEIALTRGAVIWPNDADRNDVEESGRLFLENDLVSQNALLRPAPTSRRSHFFVPVDVVHKGKLTRFAFLEGMGEWFGRKDDAATNAGARPKETTDWRADGQQFRPFREIVKQVLQTYEHGISMIFVAPCIDGPSGNPKSFAHVCLENALSEVERLRADKQRDNLLLMLSKWDGVCPPSRPGSRFADATADFVRDHLRSWSFVWPKFVQLHGFPDSARAVMPYSAAWVGEDGEVLPSSRYAPIFSRYNRTLWNWIYGNASMAMSGDAPTLRTILYPDVVPGIPQKMTSYERTLRRLTFGNT